MLHDLFPGRRVVAVGQLAMAQADDGMRAYGQPVVIAHECEILQRIAKTVQQEIDLVRTWIDIDGVGLWSLPGQNARRQTQYLSRLGHRRVVIIFRVMLNVIGNHYRNSLLGASRPVSLEMVSVTRKY